MRGIVFGFIVGVSIASIITCSHREVVTPPTTMDECRARLVQCNGDVNDLLNDVMEYKVLVDEYRRTCK